MLMKKIYSFFLMLALTCVSTAWAYDVNIKSDPENNWYSGSQSFPVADIVAALGLTDEGALADLISNTNAVYIKPAEGEPSNAYTGNHNEFWMNDQGVAQGYGDNGTCWYAGIYYDEAEGENPSDFYISVGQMPNYFKNIYTDSDLSCVLYLINGETTATFNVNLHVNAAPEPTAYNLNELDIVKEYNMSINFYVGESKTKSFSVECEDIYDMLGTTAEVLDAKIGTSRVSNNVYAEIAEKVDLGGGETSDEFLGNLQSISDAGTDGWFGRYSSYDEQAGEKLHELNAPLKWGNGCTIFMQDMSLSEGKFTIENVGQYGTTLELGAKDYINLYIINGKKAICIKAQIVMEEAPTIDPDAMIEVGSTTAEITAYIDNDYNTKPFAVDMEAICTALGCTIDDIDALYAMSGGSISDNHTEGSGGFFFNEEGVVTNWGSSSAFYVAIDNLQAGKFKVGQMAGHFTEITEPVTCNAQLVFKYLQNYYSVYVEYTVTNEAEETGDPDEEFDIADYQALEMQIIPSGKYYGDMSDEEKANMQLHLDMDKVAQIIGEGSYEFYGLRAPAASGIYPTLATSTGYTPNTGFTGGFWVAMPNNDLDEEYRVYAFVGGWGTNSYGIEWNLSNGTIGFDQIPNQRSEGDEFTSIYYLVNEDNNKAIKYTLEVKYVKEIVPESDPLGESNVTFSLSEDNIFSDGLNENLYQSDPVDWEPVFEALGITADDLETAEWMVQNSNGKLVTYGATDIFVGEDAMMDENGHYIDNIDDIDKAVFAVAFDLPTLSFAFSLLGNEPEAGVIYSTKVGLKTEAGVYVFNISAGDTETVTRVDAPEATVTIDKFIDMSGREVPVPVKGSIYVNAKRQKVVY